MIAHIRKYGEPRIESVPEHNIKVADYARIIGREKGVENIAYLSGYLHDLGKGTDCFAEYIRSAVESQYQGKGPVHSTAGGKYLYETYTDKCKKVTGYMRLTATLIAWSIFSHHGINDMVTVDGSFKFMDRMNNDNINLDTYTEAVDSFNVYNTIDIDKCFDSAVQELKHLLERIEMTCIPNADKIMQQDIIHSDGNKKNINIDEGILNKMRGFSLGLLARLNLSILIEADRTKTAEFMSGVSMDTFKIPDWKELIGKMDSYLKKLQSESCDNLKQSGIMHARTEYSRLCKEASIIASGIYQLDMPTGAGKTVASMNFAVRHALHSGKQRIFYIAPYKSILTQNANVYKDIFKDDDLIIEHHSDIIYENDNGDETRSFYTENWRGGIVLTTMVQFLNTLFGGRTQQIRRFQSLTDSVIIVDEIQSIPVECTYMFNATMNFLKMFNSTVILCSATQPVLNEAKVPIILDGSLIHENADVRQVFKRNEIIDVRDKISNCKEIAEYASELIENGNSGIIIVNTKKAALIIYDELSNMLEDCLILHISTNMCPCHQRDVIAKFNEALKIKDKKVICVSTTILEAGVDISANWVIRSVSGWDSVLQSAGRCNRHGEYDDSFVYLVTCEQENLNSMIDIRSGRECTKKALRAYKADESQFNYNMFSKQFIEYYYKIYLTERGRSMNYPIQGNLDLFDLLSLNEEGTKQAKRRAKTDIGIMTQAFKKAGESFKVIDDNTQSVIVPYREGRTIISKLASIEEYECPSKLLRLSQIYTVNLFRDKFHQYVKEGIIYKLDNHDIYCLNEDFYDEAIGINNHSLLEDLIF